MTTPSFIFVPSVYKQGLIYAELPADGSGDLTVSRGSVATRVNEDGNIELLVRNLCFNSQDWTSNWSANGVTVGANSAGFIAPNGSPTANAIVPTATNAVHRLSSNSTTAISYVSGQVYTASAHFVAGRGAAGRYVQLTLPSGAFSQGGFANFDLVDGTVTLVGGGTDANRSASIISLGGGWFRCVFTATCDVTASTTGVNVVLITAPNDALAPTFLGSTGDLLFGWGAQVEDGAAVSEYQRADTGRFNIPRLDYLQPDGTIGCPALLVEPSAQNQSLYSEQFDNAFNGKFNLNAFGSGSVANTTATRDPYGTNVADYIQEDSAAGVAHAILNIYAGNISGTTYTWSVFAKAAERTIINLLNNAGGGGSANFNLTTGVATLGSGVSASMQNYGNGWWRCILTYTSTATGNHNVQIRLCDASGNSSYNGTGNQGAYIFGAQLEVGSVATSYIPTTTAAVTRSADVISRTGATALIGQTEGTIYAEVDVRSFVSSAARRIVNLRVDGSNLLSLEMTAAGNGFDFFAAVAGVGVTASASGITTGVYKIAVGYNSATNGTALYVNGTLQDTKTIAIPNLSAVVFGLGVRADGAAGTQLNDRILAAALFTSRLTTEELIIRTAPIYNENLADSIWENYLARPSLSTELPECLRTRHNEIITI